VKTYRERLKAQQEALKALRQEAREKRKAASPAKRKKVKARYDKRLHAAQRRVERTRALLAKARVAQDKVKVQASIASKKRTWNLGTSLKSYIDRRVYYQWGQEVDYDVLEKYYPKALRRKFAWVRSESGEEDEAMVEAGGSS
jgi:DNA topoisomerase-1